MTLKVNDQTLSYINDRTKDCAHSRLIYLLYCTASSNGWSVEEEDVGVVWGTNNGLMGSNFETSCIVNHNIHDLLIIPLMLLIYTGFGGSLVCGGGFMEGSWQPRDKPSADSPTKDGLLSV